MYKQLATSLALAFAVALPASATPLFDGGTVSLSAFSAAGLTAVPGTLTGGTISPGTFMSAYQTQVFTDTNNTYCSGCLDFVYAFQNTGARGIVESLSASAFDSFMTNVGYISNGGVIPADVTRSTNGNVIKFEFGVNGFGPGSSTDFLVIQTNAMNYEPGFFSAQDGSAGTGAAYEPAAVTPEPSSLILLGTGLVGAAGAVRRKLFRA